MTSKELESLRYMLNKKYTENMEINELLKDKNVKRLLILLPSIGKIEKMETNELELLKEITKYFVITKSNGLYVLTDAYYTACKISYEDTEYYNLREEFNNPKIDCKIYRDIETNHRVKLYTKSHDVSRGLGTYKMLTSDFEKDNIVFNPYNLNNGDNGYDDLRQEFLYNSIKYGQAKSKKLLLEKYPRI